MELYYEKIFYSSLHLLFIFVLEIYVLISILHLRTLLKSDICDEVLTILQLKNRFFVIYKKTLLENMSIVSDK